MRRGTDLNPKNRFERIETIVDEYCEVDEEGLGRSIVTEWFWDQTKSIISENDSPDIPFRYSINPYRGCEHGCAYCYRRSKHSQVGSQPEGEFFRPQSCGVIARFGQPHRAGFRHAC